MAGAALLPIAEGSVCRANFAPAGRRRRLRFGMVSLALYGVGLVACIALHAAWGWRLLLFLPAAVAAVGLLQARRNTCIRRAAEGVLERDDFSTVAAPDADVAASRKVASGIRRDTLLFGLLGALVAVASAALG